MNLLLRSIFGSNETTASRLGALAAFFIGATIVFAVPIVGKFPIPELATGILFVWVLWYRVRHREWPTALLASRTMKRFLIAAAVSLAGYVVTDLVRSTPLGDMARGWARWAFLMVDIVAITYLLGVDWQNVRRYALGYSFGVIAAALTIGPQLHDYWKGGFAYPISFLLPILVPARRTLLLSLLFVALGVLHIYLGARSLGANCLLAGGIIWLSTLSRGKRYLALGLSLPAALAAVFLLYARVGEADRHEGSTTERTAMLEFAGEAFLDSPLIGQGSWFTKGSRVDAFFARRAELRGRADSVDLLGEEEVVIHSQLLIALAEGGIFGGVFFLMLAGLFLWGLWFSATNGFTLRPLVLILLLNGLWDLGMSTFSGSERIFIALSCAMLIALRSVAHSSRGEG